MYQITIAGRLGKDAEVRSIQSGDKVTTFDVAVDVRQGREKATKWVRAVMWGERGEKLAPFLIKGTTVAVTGQLDVREYESKGEHRFSVECRVDNVTLLGGGKRDETAPAERGGGTTRGKHPAADLDDQIPFSPEC